MTQAAVHLALVGATATGKSSLALAVAAELGDVEIVSADSMQVYRGMDVGTAKPTAVERAAIPHHLIDVAEPGEDYSVSRFQQEATNVIAGIEDRGHRALLVGGTGLYVQAVLDGFDVPGQWPEVRAELDADPDTDRLWRRLDELDPVAAGRMEPNNRRRVLRALEVTVGSGRAFSSFGPGMNAYPPTPFQVAGVWLPRAVVADRIRDRVHAMVAAGLVDEVRALQEQSISHTAMQALGYKEVLAHLAGECSLDDAVDTIVRRTTAFARRQRVWFRRDPRITWYGSDRNPVDVLPALLGDWSRCS